MREDRACNCRRGKRRGQPFFVFRLQKSTQNSEAHRSQSTSHCGWRKGGDEVVVVEWEEEEEGWWWLGGRSGSVVGGGGVSVVDNCRVRATKDQSNAMDHAPRTGGQRRCGGRIAGLEKKDCNGIAGLDSSVAVDVKRKSSDSEGKHTGTSPSVATTNRFVSHFNREKFLITR